MSDGHRWLLLDAAEKVTTATKINDSTAFDHNNMGPKLPKEVYLWLNEIIRAERAKIFCDDILTNQKAS